MAKNDREANLEPEAFATEFTTLLEGTAPEVAELRIQLCGRVIPAEALQKMEMQSLLETLATRWRSRDNSQD